MGILLDGFKEWYKTGIPKEPLMFEVIASLIDSYFLSVRKVRPNYFQSFGFNSEETFIDQFEDQFIKDKLDVSGRYLVARQPDDESVKRTLTFLIKQLYSKRYMVESKKYACYTLDMIIEKLGDASILEVHSAGKKRSSRSISLIKPTDLSECEKYFTPNFRNVNAKFLSLHTVIYELERSKKVWYYDLIDMIAGYFEKYDNITGGFDKPDDEESETESEREEDELKTNVSTPYAPLADEHSNEDVEPDENLSDFELENSAISYSILLASEPVGSDQTVSLVTDLKSLKELIDASEEELSEDVQLFIGLLLKRLDPNEFNAFILTYLFGGYTHKVIPLEIKNRVTKTMGVSPTAYYNYLIGFNDVIGKLKKDAKYGFDDSDVLAAINQISEVFRRNFVI